MDRVKLVWVALILVCAGPLLFPVGAQAPPLPETPPLPVDELPIVGETVNPVLDTVIPPGENETGEDLHSERIDLELFVDIRNIDYSLIGILFGGGKVDADVRAELALDFTAISAARLDDALQAMTGDSEMSLNSTFGIDSSRLAITAEEIRLIGGGVLLQAFQGYQEVATRALIESMLPGIVVLQADFEWSNTLPSAPVRSGQAEVDLRDPPIHLDAAITVNYLERYSAWEMAQAALAANDTVDAAADRSDELKRSISENQTVPLLERNAFMHLGYGQLIDVELPVGWRLNLTLSVPKGFSIEQATDEFVVSGDHETASFFVDGSERSAPFATAGVVTVSNRFLVTTTVLAALALVGFVMRFVVESAVFGGRAGLTKWAEHRAVKAEASEAMLTFEVYDSD